MDTAVSFRGAALNLKDCRYPTNLSEWAAWLKYPVLCLLVISGVGSFVSDDGEKSLVWFIISFVFILVCSLSLLDLHFTSTLLAVLVLFPDAQKGLCVCFGVWCPLPSAGGVSVPLWRFDSKT